MTTRTESRTTPNGREYGVLIARHEGVEMHADPRDRIVYWASDWTRMHEYPLDRRHGGPGTYGHIDYIIR